jgi:hypothetical protein
LHFKHFSDISWVTKKFKVLKPNDNFEESPSIYISKSITMLG